MNNPYGTHPEALGDLLDAIGPQERGLVRQLSREEDDALAAVSLRRFPTDRATTGAIDWSGAVVLEQSFEQDYADAARVLGERVLRYSTSDVVVFWGNLVIPTVRLPARLAAANAGELIDTGDDVWIYLPDRNVLVEYWHSGRITAGMIPDAVAGP
ncbi:hypothetical protein [Amycolatopsis sp. NPDC059021]|uniref:hypothetical protein n=1 Tax=Amycolatopsis sp. NPDC059021 TaxID=3346704 RepID=UPI00366E6B3D